MTKLYAVRDNVMEKNAPPFAAPNDAAAIRVFKNLAFPKESPMVDFSLVCMGTYDEDKADYPVIFQPEGQPIPIIEGDHE